MMLRSTSIVIVLGLCALAASAVLRIFDIEEQCRSSLAPLLRVSAQVLVVVVAVVFGLFGVVAALLLLSALRAEIFLRSSPNPLLHPPEPLRKIVTKGMHSPEADEMFQRMERRAERLVNSIEKISDSFPRHVDVIFDAAGFRGQVSVGACMVLARTAERVRVRRWVGGSGGGQLAVLAALGAEGRRDLVRFVFGWRACRTALLGERLTIWTALWVICRGGFVDILCALCFVLYKPHFENYRKLPAGTCLISVLALPSSFSKWIRFWFSRLWNNVAADHKESRDSFRPEFLSDCCTFEELARAVMATGSIPGVSTFGLWTRFRDLRCLDGGFCSRVPRPPAVPVPVPEAPEGEGPTIPSSAYNTPAAT